MNGPAERSRYPGTGHGPTAHAILGPMILHVRGRRQRQDVTRVGGTHGHEPRPREVEEWDAQPPQMSQQSYTPSRDQWRWGNERRSGRDCDTIYNVMVDPSCLHKGRQEKSSAREDALAETSHGAHHQFHPTSSTGAVKGRTASLSISTGRSTLYRSLFLEAVGRTWSLCGNQSGHGSMQWRPHEPEMIAWTGRDPSSTARPVACISVVAKIAPGPGDVIMGINGGSASCLRSHTPCAYTIAPVC